MNVSAANRPFGSLVQRIRFAALVCLFAVCTSLMLAQSAGMVQGMVTDTRGGGVARAVVAIKSDATGRTLLVTADAMGHYALANLAAGSYTLTVTAPGFAPLSRKTTVAVDQPATVDLALAVGSATSDITVEADATGSIAASLAPMDALITETSPHTEITSAMIQNFMSPVADYGEAVEMAPGTFTTNGNGVGLGQSKTYFRGFPDGDYDIDFDGIPFYDTNSPTHHSWAFFPTQFLGGIDFDRSPGTASTIGPTPFGGSIHLLSKPFDPISNIRFEFSGGSYHTFLYDGEYDSGAFGPGKKFNTMIDVHHLQSNGFQTYNFQTRNAGDIQFLYKVSNRTTLTGYSAVIWLDANTPNFSATRCQMYGVSATNAYSCIIGGTTLYPYTGYGRNFLNANNSDPEIYLDYQYNYYHVPTDFEYVDVHSELGKGFTLDVKPYTYDYDNSEKYTNAVPISDNPALAGTTYAPLAAKVVLCTTPVVKKGVTAIPCGIDKYNSYRKYGEVGDLAQTSKWGTLHAGLWYEWANTNRHQYPSDPLTHWTDQALPSFAEKFVTNSYQFYGQYEAHPLKRLSINFGVKDAYYTIGTKQFADDGKTIGGLGTNNPAAFVTNAASYNAILPAGSINYRIKQNWSFYFQGATGSVVPPSSVFDFAQGTAGVTPVSVTPPKQQRNTTYQEGTVLKLKRVTFDADYYHIAFDNSYACTLNTSSGDDNVCTFQPPSVTQGFEAESNIYIFRGISLYLNATKGKATYTGSLVLPCIAGTGCTATNAPTYTENVPSNIWVAQTPSDTETEGITYQKGAWDAGIFNKRVGTFYIDNGNLNGFTFHNQATIQPFSLTNLFLNYTVRTGGRFDQTKLRVSFNNVFNESNVTGISLNANPNSQTIAANGTTYTDAFNTNGQTPISGQDNISILPGHSIMFSAIFGFSPHKSR